MRPDGCERCSTVEDVSNRALSALRSPIRARAPKCHRRRDSREKMVTRACEPTGASKSHGRADKLIDLVSSSSIDDTLSVFDESAVKRAGSIFPTGAPTRLRSTVSRVSSALRSARDREFFSLMPPLTA